MSDVPSQPESAQEQLRTNLAALAHLLRTTRQLGPEAQEELAEIVDELGRTITSGPAASAETANLAASAAHLVDALCQKKDSGILSEARNRVENAIVAAEARAPFAAGLAQRLVDVLTDIGI
jgi:hypothetical protein